MILGIIPEQGGSITNLARSGQHTRFLNVYMDEYARAFEQVRYFSYLPESFELPPNCTVVPNPGHHRWAYAFGLPLLQRGQMRSCSVLRVMQAYGAIPALEAKAIYGIPFAATWGYQYGEIEAAKGAGRLRSRLLDARAALGARFADRIIVTTPTMADYVSRRARPRAITVIPNGVETALFRPPAQGEGPPDGEFVIVYVGRLSAEKNPGLLLDAVAALQGARTARPLRVVLVGDGNLRGEVEQQAARLRINVEFAGVVSNERLPGLLRASHLFVLPTLGEGHPKALLEAMSVGLPCVGTDVRGVRELLRHEETGLLCAVDAGALAAAMRRVLEDRDLAHRLGVAARDDIVARFDLRRLLHEEIAMLKEVAAQRPQRGRV